MDLTNNNNVLVQPVTVRGLTLGNITWIPWSTSSEYPFSIPHEFLHKRIGGFLGHIATTDDPSNIMNPSPTAKKIKSRTLNWINPNDASVSGSQWTYVNKGGY